MKLSSALFTTCMLWLLGVGTACAPSGHASLPPERPNILLILVDDLGKEWISCYGADSIATPHIDQLAAGGMLFHHAYSMPQCTPTRITLLTGQYPFRHGWVNHWDVPRWGGGCHFDWRKYPSMARMLQAAGYATAAAGKWQVNDFRLQPEAMRQHGFDDWCMWTGYEAGNPPSAERYWNPYLFTQDGSKTYQGQFGADVFTDFLIGFMEKHRAQPMFLYFPMALTHTPLVPTPDEPDLGPDKQARHKAMVRYTDKMVGKLVAALERLDLRRRTLILFTTDNGTTRAIEGSLRGRKVKGGKGQTLESGICEPFIVNWPGTVPEGTQTHALTDFTDLLPTFAELAGASLPAGAVLDGVSQADIFRGNSTHSARSWILAMGGQNRARLTPAGVENEYYYRDRVLRDERYKVYIGPDRQPAALYDLQQDPAENQNLLHSQDPAIRAALNKFLEIEKTFPPKDNDPIYEPVSPQKWDVPVTAKSQIWKIGHPQYTPDAVLNP